MRNIITKITKPLAILFILLVIFVYITFLLLYSKSLFSDLPTFLMAFGDTLMPPLRNNGFNG